MVIILSRKGSYDVRRRATSEPGASRAARWREEFQSGRDEMSGGANYTRTYRPTPNHVCE